MTVEFALFSLTKFPSIVASSVLTAQVATLNPFVSVTSPNDGKKHQYELAGYLNMTAFTNGSATFQISWTESGIAHNGVSIVANQNGGLVSGVVGVSINNFFPAPIVADPNTAVILAFIVIGVNTSNVGGFINQLS